MKSLARPQVGFSIWAKEMRDNLPAFLRHLIKWMLMKNYRARLPLFAVSYRSIKSDFLETEIRKSGSKINICDIGTFSVESLDSGIRRLMNYDFTDLTLVEPQEAEAATLKKAMETKWGEDRTHVIKRVIGRGDTIEFRITNDTSASSGYEPNLEVVNRYHNFWLDKPLAVVKRVNISTETLEKALAGKLLDHLTMDIQGMELDVLESSPKILKNLIVIELEAEVKQYYLKQPLFEDVLLFMKKNGFELFSFRKFTVPPMREFRYRPSWSWYPWKSNYFEPRELVITQPIFVRADFTDFAGTYDAVLRAAFVLEKMYLAYDKAFDLLRVTDRHFKKENAPKYYDSLPNKIKFRK